jgi:hypothetical protein
MKILFLSANPRATVPLDLEQELRSLERELGAVRHRDRIDLVARHAVQPDDLIRHVRTERPTVVHFSGHGTAEGILLRTDDGGYLPVTGESLQRFFKGRGVELVVLASCLSRPQAEQIATSVPMVVGTDGAVDDEAARRFSVAFYRTLGQGDTVTEALRDGRDAVALHGRPDVFLSYGALDRPLCPEALAGPRHPHSRRARRVWGSSRGCASTHRPSWSPPSCSPG